jgi:hypothetical protein
MIRAGGDRADGRQVTVPPGFSVLEASWLLGVPHASVCGGRGRCSTCRVRVVGAFPAASHSPILYPAALVREGPAARQVMAYLAGGEARGIFRAQGFLPA